MRAVVIRSFGGPDVLEVAEVPGPTPGPGQVRIRVQAAGVNPVDAATREGWLVEAGLQPPRQVIGLGWDVAGTVDELGVGVTRFRPGDRVVGLCDRLDRAVGPYADYAVLDEGDVAAAPATVPAVAAATLPLNALTADQALDLLDLQPGQSLLVTGAAGGLGGFAVQLAALRRLRVVAVASEHDEQLVRGLGAERFVPRSADLAAAVRTLLPGGVDAAIDGATVGLRALDAVRGGGAYIAVAAGAAPPPLRGTRVTNVWIRADGARLAELVSLVDTGRLTLRVAGTYPLAEAAAAHKRLAEGGLRGRLVLVP
jgi:NADPH:quinone reductase